MIIDKRTEFADAASVVGAAAPTTALLGNQIDLGSAGIDLGVGTDLWFVISVDTEVITAGSAGTIKFQLVSDDSAAIATDGSATVHYDSGTLVTDGADANSPLLKAGKFPVAVKLPAEGPAYERYLGVLVTRATTATTAGAVSAYLTPVLPTRMKYYPDGAN